MTEGTEKVAFILIADGTEEIEFVTAYDILVRAGFEVNTVGVNLKNDTWAECSRGLSITPSIRAIALLPNPLQLALQPTSSILVIPGGAKGANTLLSTPAVVDLVRHFRMAEKHTAFICAGTLVLCRSVEGGNGLASKKCRVTSHPSVEEEVRGKGWEYSTDRVVVDGKVITSRGPGTAMEWALKIVEEIMGREKMEEVKGPLICADST